MKKFAKGLFAVILALACIMGFSPSGAYAAVHVQAPSIAAIIPMMSMHGNSFDGARTIEEYADRLAQRDNFKKTKIILTLQACLFLKKAQEELDDTEAVRYSKVLDAINEHPVDWPKFAEIPDYSPKSPLGEDMVKLLAQDKSFLSNESLSERFETQAKDLYMNIRDFAYSMGYVRLFDNYFAYPGNPLISREARDALPKDGAAREMKELQVKVDSSVLNAIYVNMGLSVGLMLIICLGPIIFDIIRKRREEA